MRAHLLPHPTASMNNPQSRTNRRAPFPPLPTTQELKGSGQQQTDWEIAFQRVQGGGQTSHLVPVAALS